MFSGCLLFLLVVAAAGAEKIQPRMYNNPLTSKTVDLWLLIDEANSRLNLLQFEQMKIAVNNVATELTPVGSSPKIRIFFYGATTSVHQVVALPVSSSSVIKSSLSLKQYTPSQPNPSTLVAALNAVNVSCFSTCSTNSRVIVVFSTAPDATAEARIRLIEKEHQMTVIVVGIGSNTSVLNLLASHPSRIYAIPFSSFTELIVSAPLISSLITSVPPYLLASTPMNYGTLQSGVFYTVHLVTGPFALGDNAVIRFTSNCISCGVYTSLSEPNPTKGNTVATPRVLSTYPSGYADYHIRVPRSTVRVFLSLQGNGQAGISGTFSVFNLPAVLQNGANSDPTPNLVGTIG